MALLRFRLWRTRWLRGRSRTDPTDWCGQRVGQFPIPARQQGSNWTDESPVT